MNEQTRQRLGTFVQTADELLSLRFTKFVREEWNPTIAMHFSNEHGIRIDRQRPQEEAMRAFVLTFRIFVQDRDGISLRALANDVQKGNIDASADWQKMFLQERANLNLVIDQPSPIIEVNGQFGDPNAKEVRYSLREVMDTFLYGWLAHKDAKYTPIFEAWKHDEEIFETRSHEFLSTLINIFRTIEYLANETRKELQKP